MKIIKLLFSVVFVSGFVQLSCSQQHQLAQRTYAYKVVKQLGRKPIDLNGTEIFRPADTLIYVYTETEDSSIQWKYAWQNQKLFSIAATLVVQNPVVVGTNIQTGEKISIVPTKNHFLWQLELLPSSENIPPPIKKKNKSIIIQGQRNNKVFNWVTDSAKLIQQPDAG